MSAGCLHQCKSLILESNHSFSGLETLQQNRRHSMFFQSVNLGEMVMCLEDLINYFAQPDDDMGNFDAIKSNRDTPRVTFGVRFASVCRA